VLSCLSVILSVSIEFLHFVSWSNNSNNALIKIIVTTHTHDAMNDNKLPLRAQYNITQRMHAGQV